MKLAAFEDVAGASAFIAHFAFARAPRGTPPTVYVCSQPDCPTILWIERMTVVTPGFVTCARCMKPMQVAG